MEEYDYIYKILLVGDASSGKGSFLIQYTENILDDGFVPTIGFDFKLKTLQMEDGKKVKLQIWDTAGQERFKNITASYYRGANGIILIYSINARESFDNLTSWIIEINKQYTKNKKPPIFLVGNQMKEEERLVKKEEGKAFADKFGLMFSECNSKTGENVNSIFNKLVKTINGKNVDENLGKNIEKILMKYLSF